jgi:hypothetical protein
VISAEGELTVRAVDVVELWQTVETQLPDLKMPADDGACRGRAGLSARSSPFCPPQQSATWMR